MTKQLLLLIISLIISFSVLAEETDKTKFTISGYIKDNATGEELIGASVVIPGILSGTITNAYGFYSLTVPKGNYEVSYSFLGYATVTKKIVLNENIKLNINLGISSEIIEDVVIEGERKDENVKAVEMSVAKLPMRTIKKIPALMGEVDLIKSIQMLPGVASAGEGFSGFYVRGGGVDQNLVLLDESVVYNASHLGGLFSVFNSDAIKDVKLYKGGIPAEYGGRLSSVLDVRMKDGNSKTLSGTGGIGIISSRLTLEGPIIKDKMSFIISGRRTYYDLFLPLSKDTNIQKATIYFYDFNAKANYTINDKNRLFLSGYFGRDVLGFGDLMQMGYGNKTGTIRWNHLFNEKLFSNFTYVYSNFDYSLGSEDDVQAFKWLANTIDQGLKGDLTYYFNPNNTIKFGGSIIHHTFRPGTTRATSDNSIISEIKVPESYATEEGIFVSNEQKINALISMTYGLRFSIFSNVGPGTTYSYDKSDPQSYKLVDTIVYKNNEFYNTNYGLEPRLGIRYQLNESSSIKASYNRMYQYLHLASNSTASTPLDVWFPTGPNIKPQISDQVALGYFRNFKSDAYETSVEVYYKKIQNAIDFKDHAWLLLNEQLEGEIRVGEAYSYGLELMVRKQLGKFTGWVSYTLSKTMRKIPEINNGKAYSAPYDKPHDVSIIASYDLYPRLNLSATWVYSSGRPMTVPKGRFEYQGMLVPIYGDRNSVRMPAYHRLDLSITYEGKKKERGLRRNGKPRLNYESSWNLSVYNVYSRHNTYSINFKQDTDNPNQTYAENMYLFKIFPSITYNFSF